MNTDDDGFDNAEVEEDEKILYKSMKELNLSSGKDWDSDRLISEVRNTGAGRCLSC